MDVISRRYVQPHSVKRLRWTDSMITILLNAMLDARKLGPGAKTDVWGTAIGRLAESGVSGVTAKQCSRKWENLCSLHALWHQHVDTTWWKTEWTRGVKGGVPRADDAVMDSYFVLHPKRAVFRRHPPPFLDLMQTILDIDVATFEYAFGPNESPPPVSRRQRAPSPGQPHLNAQQVNAMASKRRYVSETDAVTTRLPPTTHEEWAQRRIKIEARLPPAAGIPVTCFSRHSSNPHAGSHGDVGAFII